MPIIYTRILINLLAVRTLPYLLKRNETLIFARMFRCRING